MRDPVHTIRRVCSPRNPKRDWGGVRLASPKCLLPYALWKPPVCRLQRRKHARGLVCSVRCAELVNPGVWIQRWGSWRVSGFCSASARGQRAKCLKSPRQTCCCQPVLCLPCRQGSNNRSAVFFRARTCHYACRTVCCVHYFIYMHRCISYTYIQKYTWHSDGVHHSITLSPHCGVLSRYSLGTTPIPAIRFLHP